MPRTRYAESFVLPCRAYHWVILFGCNFIMGAPLAMILADGSRAEMRAAVERLRPALERYLQIVRVSLDPTESLDDCEAELAVVIGGDGSILRSAHQMGYRQRPVLGINLGRLGFLAALQPEQLEAALPQFTSGAHQVVEHLMYECFVERNGTTIIHALGLNEAAVLAGPPFSMVEVELYVDGELATTYSCDGLIVSTPVGSTAHSLSAGGPILRKDLQAFVITPICPHTLTHRPVVDLAERVIGLAVPHPNPGTSLVADGRLLCTLTQEDRVRIIRSSAVFRLVEVSGQGYYRTLHDKLGWGGQISTRSPAK